jgi:hypothetical protein
VNFAKELVSLVNMTLYGFLVMLLAAFMFLKGKDQAGYLMLTTGATMVGVTATKRDSQPSVNVDKINTAVVESGK